MRYRIYIGGIYVFGTGTLTEAHDHILRRASKAHCRLGDYVVEDTWDEI